MRFDLQLRRGELESGCICARLRRGGARPAGCVDQRDGHGGGTVPLIDGNDGHRPVAEIDLRAVLVSGVAPARRDSRQDASERHVRLRSLLRQSRFCLEGVRIALARGGDEYVERLERQRGQ